MIKILFILLILLLVGCTEVVCNDPYIYHEQACCLDKDSNSICDIDEVKENPEETVEIEKPSPAAVEEENKIEKKPEPQEEPVEELDFSVDITPVKQDIRMIDQALFDIIIHNNGDATESFTMTLLTENWVMFSNPWLSPIRIPVLKNKQNNIRLILQPDKKIIKKGDHNVTVKFTSTAGEELERELVINIT